MKVIDASGGNIIDACMLAAVSALRGFRKPETSVVSKVEQSPLLDLNVESNKRIIIHSSFERDPLPLAFQHTPLTVAIGLFKFTAGKVKDYNIEKSILLLFRFIKILFTYI